MHRSGKPPRGLPDEPSETEPASPLEFSGPLLTASSSREAAFRALEVISERRRRVGDVLLQVLQSATLSPADRGLARELTFGVVRRETPLNVLLEHLLKRPVSEIEPPLAMILRLGLYQIIYADQIPAHAAVHETVELAKRAGRLRWAGFVNGVLRSATRLCTEEFVTAPSESAIPVSGRRFRRLTESVFPDPRADFAGYFWRAYSYPEWLGRRWAQRWTPETLQRIGDWQRTPPPVFVRVNLLKTSRDELQQQFQASGLDVVAESLPEALRVLSGGRVEEWPGYADGLFSVQDLSAMRAARRLMPSPGNRVLDLCAAPGGKSCHLAELMQDSGEVLAVDVAPNRLERIVENVRRLGLSSVHALLVREDGGDLPRGPFDFILADVPCSNTGVLGRRPEVVWDLSPESITELTLIQSHLLRRAAERLKPGGGLLYSTCSIEPEENEQLVQQFLAEHPQFLLREEELMLPGQPADGGYQALLVRR